MSDHQKENALRIAAYLENRLSPEEKEAFKRNLGEDDELRLQYVDALMNRAATGQDAGSAAEPAPGAEDTDRAGETLVEPENTGGADETLIEPEDTGGASVGEREEAGEARGNWESLGEQGARDAWEAGWSAGRERPRGGFFGSRWMVGVAVLLLVVAGVAIIILIRKEGFWNNAVAATPVDSGGVKKGNMMDSAAVKVDSGRVAAAGMWRAPVVPGLPLRAGRRDWAIACIRSYTSPTCGGMTRWMCENITRNTGRGTIQRSLRPATSW